MDYRKHAEVAHEINPDVKMWLEFLKETEEEDFLMVPSQELIENTDELAEEIAANIDA